MSAFYTTLADWWPVLSPVDEYADEAAEVLQLIETHHPAAETLLELGSGGGHVAFHLRARMTCCLTDLHHEMLAVSQRLNPSCEHVAGDMRTLALHRTFDVVLAHDAIDYMVTESDLAQVLDTAWRHLKPGGLLVLLPDTVAETFEAGADVSGGEASDGRAAQLLEWSEPVAPGTTSAVVHYGFLLRDADGHVRMEYDRHECGVFPEATWVRLLAARGFEVQVLDEATAVDRPPRRLFLGRKP